MSLPNYLSKLQSVEGRADRHAKDKVEGLLRQVNVAWQRFPNEELIDQSGKTWTYDKRCLTCRVFERLKRCTQTFSNKEVLDSSKDSACMHDPAFTEPDTNGYFSSISIIETLTLQINFQSALRSFSSNDHV